MTSSADQLGQYFVRIKNVKNEKSQGSLEVNLVNRRIDILTARLNHRGATLVRRKPFPVDPRVITP